MVNITDMTGVLSISDRDLIELGIRLTWKRFNLPWPKTFWVIVESRLDGDCAAIYNPISDVLLFSIDNIERMFSVLSRGEALLLCACHEVTHKAQFTRGESPTPSHRNWRYDNCPFEDEAWREAIRTFKLFYPRASGTLVANDLSYVL